MEGESETCAKNMHSISILNFSSGEEICHSIVLIEGVVKSGNKCKAPMEVTLEKINGPICSPPPSIHEISKNMSFKCLLKLELGMNRFILNFCSVHEEIILYFRPRQTDFCVTPLYVICKGHDGRFQAPQCEDNSIESACDRISTGVHLIQSLLAERLQKSGYGRITFQLQSDLDQKVPECQILYSDISVEKAHSASAATLWTWLAREIMLSKLGCKNRKYIAFLSSTHYDGSALKKEFLTHEEILQSTKGYVSLGGGGLALVGTGCLHTWAPSIEEVVPRLLSTVVVDTKHFMDESSYRGTYGGCYATTLGAAAHEMGHTFDLGHTSHGIMGSDYYNIHYMLLTEEHPASHVNVPSKYVPVKSSSVVEEQVGLKTLPDEAKEKQIFETFVQELKVNWSMPKSQIACKPAGLLQSEKINIVNQLGKHKITENIKCCSPMPSVQRQYETSAKRAFSSSPTLDIDDVSPFWQTSSLSILALHKWFNPDSTTEYSGNFEFDISQRQIKSEYALGVIEIRDSESMSILHWKFPGRFKTKEFTIPDKYIYPKSHMLWVIDQVGNSKAFDLKQ